MTGCAGEGQKEMGQWEGSMAVCGHARWQQGPGLVGLSVGGDPQAGGGSGRTIELSPIDSVLPRVSLLRESPSIERPDVCSHVPLPSRAFSPSAIMLIGLKRQLPPSLACSHATWMVIVPCTEAEAAQTA